MVSMRRWTSVVLTVAFILWILPLGIFIAPSKEKLFCDGQRAICMCSHIGKHHPAPAGESFSKADDQKEDGAGFSSTHYDALAQAGAHDVQILAPNASREIFYSLLISSPVEHVPKA
jgi:hypothetical protein